MKFVFESVENLVGKRETAGHQHYLLLRGFFVEVV